MTAPHHRCQAEQPWFDGSARAESMGRSQDVEEGLLDEIVDVGVTGTEAEKQSPYVGAVTIEEHSETAEVAGADGCHEVRIGLRASDVVSSTGVVHGQITVSAPNVRPTFQAARGWRSARAGSCGTGATMPSTWARSRKRFVIGITAPA